MTEFEELEFLVNGNTLRARLYGKALLNNKENPPHRIISLHGWLDNCASFSFVAPRFAANNCVVLALDLPGHGLSYHRDHLGAYNIWQDIPEILLIADQMQWQRFGLISHSRGAMISTLLAATAPQRVNFLGLIDGIIPLPIQKGEILKQLQQAVTGSLTHLSRKKNFYESFDLAVKAREQGFVALEHQDALVLAERGVREEEGRFYWANDQKLLIPSEMKFTLDELHQVVDGVGINIHLVVGEDGIISDFEYVLEWLKQFSRVKIRYLPGSHHLHMSEQSEAVTEVFLESLEATQ